MNISASQIKTFSKCPKQYEYRYKTDQEPTKQNDKYLKLGNRVHAAIENILEELEEDVDHRMLSSMFQQEYHGLTEIKVPDDLYDDGLKSCKTAARVIDKRDIEPLYIEKRREYQINDQNVDTGVTAIMDIVTESMVWDWKTGRIRDDTGHDEKIQGAVYMAAFLDLMGEPPEKVAFAYLKEEKIRSIEPGDEVWDHMLSHAQKLLRAVSNGEYRAKPGDPCYWCDYEYDCDVAPAGCGGVNPEDY